MMIAKTCYEDSDVNDSTIYYEESEVEDGLEKEWLNIKSGHKKAREKWIKK